MAQKFRIRILYKDYADQLKISFNIELYYFCSKYFLFTNRDYFELMNIFKEFVKM